MRLRSLPTSGMLEPFLECGSVVSCCHHNLHQKHLLPPGRDCVLKAFLSYVACADIWEKASSISVQFVEKGFSDASVVQSSALKLLLSRLWSQFHCQAAGQPWTSHCHF